MSGVIKSSDRNSGVHVRELALEPLAPVPSADARLIVDLERRLAEADSLIETLRVDVARLNAAALGSWSEGHAVGVIEGRQAAEDQSGALLKRLSETSADALGDFRNSMAGLETAAAGLASIALGRIVGDVSGRQSLVNDTIRRAIDDLFAGSLLTVEVSRADFPDAASIKSVALPDGAELHAVEALPSGDCRLRLKLGEVDLGLDGQIARLRMLLDDAIGAAK